LSVTLTTSTSSALFTKLEANSDSGAQKASAFEHKNPSCTTNVVRNIQNRPRITSSPNQVLKIRIVVRLSAAALKLDLVYFGPTLIAPLSKKQIVYSLDKYQGQETGNNERGVFKADASDSK
jgi:hypothetical protein